MTSRREFLGAAGAFFAPAALPNFLILHTDDQRFDTVRALGNGDILTPNMDRLVARGVTFTQATTQGGLSGAICMPSRAQMLTGCNVFRVHRSIVDRQANPDPEMSTFPERLRERGYATFHTGKWHLGAALHHRSFGAGANIFFGGMSDHSKMQVFDYDSGGRYPKEKSRPAAGYSSEVIADSAIRFLKEREPGKPFLAYAAFTSPHDPRTPPERFAAMYPPEKIKLPPNFAPQHAFDNGDLKVRDELLANFPRTEAEIRRHLAAYYAMVSEVDHQIGRVVEALDASGAADNTYIIFAGDNGLAVGQHGLMGKQNLYEHSLRVPLVICGPGLSRGRRKDGLCHLMDIAPTICELGGTKLPRTVDGNNLLGPLNRRSTFAAYRNFQRAIRRREMKLVVYAVGGGRTTQMFDLARDPWEQNNVAHLPGFRKLRAEMERELAAMLRAAGDPNLEAFTAPR